MNCIDGTETKDPSSGSVQLPAQQVKPACLSALELDRVRYMGIHRGGEHSDCAALSGGERPIVERDGQLIMVDDDACPRGGRAPCDRKVRFRTLAVIR